MEYFYEMKVLSPYDDSRISTEKLKEMARWQLANMIAEKVVKEARAEMNPEGTYILASWETNEDCGNDWEMFEWPTP